VAIRIEARSTVVGSLPSNSDNLFIVNENLRSENFIRKRLHGAVGTSSSD
jgi:hypothetical protein